MRPAAVALALIPIALSGAAPARAAAQLGARADTVAVGLAELVRVAMMDNLRLRAAYAEVRGTATAARATRSRYDPIFNLGTDSDAGSVGGQVVGLLPTGASYLVGSVAPSTLPGEPIYPNAIVASVSQPLLRGLGFKSARPAIRAVDAGIAASRERLVRARAEVSVEIGLSYALLVERHRQEAIVARSLLRAEELRDAYTELHRLEKITEIDLITAQLGVASRQASLLEVRRDRREAEDALVFAVYGARAPTVFARGEAVLMPTDTAVVATTLDALDALDAATDRAIAARPDVVAARHDTERARLQVEYARNASLPTLNISAALTSTKLEQVGVSNGLRRDSRVEEWSVGLVMSRPLRNSGASAERERAAAQLAEAEVALLEAENAVRAEVRAAYRDIELGREQVALAAEASRLARRQYDGERERLTLGLTDLFRVLQYEEQVSRVERAEASARLSYAASVLRLELALGGR